MTKAPKVCRRCGQPARPDEALSHAGYHIGCGLAAMDEANRQQSARRGPAYEKWLAAGGAKGRPPRENSRARG